MNKEELLQQEAERLYPDPDSTRYGWAESHVYRKDLAVAAASRSAYIRGRNHLPATNAGDIGQEIKNIHVACTDGSELVFHKMQDGKLFVELYYRDEYVKAGLGTQYQTEVSQLNTACLTAFLSGPMDFNSPEVQQKFQEIEADIETVKEGAKIDTSALLQTFSTPAALDEQALQKEADACAHAIMGCTEEDGIVTCRHFRNCKCEAIARGYREHARVYLANNNELEDLRRWKAEAMAVMPDFQEISKLLNIPLGQTVHDKIIPAIKQLQANNTQLAEAAWDECEAAVKENSFVVSGNPAFRNAKISFAKAAYLSTLNQNKPEK